jgi:peptidyl-prolyl cis-trans isomerase B (cyclophilin B)
VGTAKRDRQRANRQQRLQELQKTEKRDQTKKRALQVVGVVVLLAAVVFGLSRLVGSDKKTEITASSAANAATTVATPTPTSDGAVTSLPAAGTTVAPSTGAAFVYGTGACAAADGSSPKTDKFSDTPKQCLDPSKSYTATFETTEGSVKVALDTTRTPGTTNNFVNLALFKYYDGTPIFRTDPGIDIIQGGGASNTADPGYSITDEGGKFTYAEGDLVMARTGAPNSAGGQFFFVTGRKASLLDAQGTYVTFGKVVTGLDVVKKIIALHVADDSGLGGKPSKPVTITRVVITAE